MSKIDDIKTKPHVYSWSTKVDFVLNSVGGFEDLEEASVQVPWGEDYLLTLEKQDIHPQLRGAGATGYRFNLDATETACEAEEVGKRLACSLLKVAIDKNWGLRLSWQDTPLPCRVVDRTISRGPSVTAFGSVTSHLTLEKFSSELGAIFKKLSKAPYRVLLSMELCASAKFESDNRAKLILLISALEAIAAPEEYLEITDLINSMCKAVADASISDDSLKQSLLGQVRNLKRESSRRAIRRKLNEAGFPKVDLEFVDTAYGSRSKIVHSGRRVPELSNMNAELERIISQVYTHELSIL